MLKELELLDFLADQLGSPEPHYPAVSVLSCIITIFRAAAHHAPSFYRSELFETPLVRLLCEEINPQTADMDGLNVLITVIGLLNPVFARFLSDTIALGEVFTDAQFSPVRSSIASQLAGPPADTDPFLAFLRGFVTHASVCPSDAILLPDLREFDLAFTTIIAILEVADLCADPILNELIWLFPAQHFAKRLTRTFTDVKAVDKDRIVRLFRRLVCGACDEQSLELVLAIFVELNPCLYEYALDAEQREDVWPILRWFQEQNLCPELVQEFAELFAEMEAARQADPDQDAPGVQERLDELAMAHIMVVTQAAHYQRLLEEGECSSGAPGDADEETLE
jgi:hypothetical protein